MRFGRTLLLLALAPLCAMAADLSGKWTSTFDTQVGQQNYTYVFTVDGTRLTGKAISANGETAIEEGTVKGDDISFVEKLTFQNRDLVLTYTGKIVSADEIQLTRDVSGFYKETLVAKRSK
jgi:hypothetical protein